jgi:zinc protease
VGVFAERDPAIPVVHVYLTFLAGSELDPPGLSGRTRLAAQMLRMGTRRRTREELDRAVEMLGAELDVSSSHHRVNVSGHVMTEMLDPFLTLLDEVLNEAGMRETDFEKLRRETLADIVAEREDDQSVAYRHFRAMLFGDHGYGRPNMGTCVDVSGAAFRDVERHHDRVLRRAPAIVGLAGDMDPERMAERLSPMLDAFTTGDLAASEPPDPGPPEGVRVRLVDKPARTQSQIYVGHLGLRAAHDDYFPVALLNTAFGGTFTARLSREIRKERGWSYGAYSRMLRSRRRDAFYLWSFPEIDNTVDCIALELEMLEALRDEALADEELDFARSYLAHHFLFAVETASLRVALAMRQRVLELPEGFYENYRQSVLGVTTEQVRRAARRFVRPRDLCICALCTADRVQPELTRRLPDASIEVVGWDEDV